MRVVRVGLSLHRGRPSTICKVAAVISFNQATYAEIRSAAKQTNLPITSYLQELVEADLASRRLAASEAEERSQLLGQAGTGG